MSTCLELLQKYNKRGQKTEPFNNTTELNVDRYIYSLSSLLIHIPIVTNLTCGF
jgi:hypothetical protein